jgi:hypothetical protein
MHKVTRIVTAALTVVTLGILAAIPLFAAWRMPGGQCIAPVSTTPLKLAGQEAATPLVAGHCTLAGWSPKQPELMADPVRLNW